MEKEYNIEYGYKPTDRRYIRVRCEEGKVREIARAIVFGMDTDFCVVTGQGGFLMVVQDCM